MNEQARTERLYDEARAIVREHDHIQPYDKERLLYLPPLYLIQWCRMAGLMKGVRDD